MIHGSFHGSLLAESLLSAILFMNHRMPDMWRNFTNRRWDRGLQKESRLLADQTVLIIGGGDGVGSLDSIVDATATKLAAVSDRHVVE